VLRRFFAISTLLALLAAVVLCASAQCPVLQVASNCAHPCCPHPDSHPVPSQSAQDCPYLLLGKAKAPGIAVFGSVPMATLYEMPVAVSYRAPLVRTYVADSSGLHLRLRLLLI
jgi:hypothetical protein